MVLSSRSHNSAQEAEQVARRGISLFDGCLDKRGCRLARCYLDLIEALSHRGAYAEAKDYFYQASDDSF